jgi:hypothetical protein
MEKITHLTEKENSLFSEVENSISNYKQDLNNHPMQLASLFFLNGLNVRAAVSWSKTQTLNVVPIIQQLKKLKRDFSCGIKLE